MFYLRRGAHNANRSRAQFLLTHIDSPVRSFSARERGAHSAQEEDTSWKRCDSDMPPEIVALSHAFPMGCASSPYSTYDFAQYLPPEDEALEFINIYYATNAAMYVRAAYLRRAI